MPETLTAPISEHVGAEEAITAAAAAVDQPLPGFEPPPYDAAGWNRRLASKQRAVLQAKAAWKAAAEKAAGLKKTWERETDEQDELYRVMDNERRQAEGELVQPSLRPVASGPQSSDCRYSQETGEACPGCILLRKAGAPLPDPEDTGHSELVRDALVQAGDRSDLYEIVSLEYPVALTEVEGWTPEQAKEVALWLALNGELPEEANHVPTPSVLQTTEQVMEEAKVCLCEKPKGKKTCKSCGGNVTGKTK